MIKKYYLFILPIILLLLFLSSCNHINPNFASKINRQNSRGNPLSYEEVIEKLGTPHYINITDANNVTGEASWFIGADSLEDALQRSINGEIIQMLNVKIENNWAVYAWFYIDIAKKE